MVFKQHIGDLEKVQIVFSRTIQSFQADTSSSIARGRLEFWGINSKISGKNYTLLVESLIPTYA